MPHVLRFGILAEAGRDERTLLLLAGSYRLALYQSHLAEHRARIEFRNEQFPDLWNALIEWERWKAECYRIEERIKAYHSEVRNRNAVRPEDEESLREARECRQAAYTHVRSGRKLWSRFLATYKAAFHAAGTWKNVKTLGRREAQYRDLDWAKLLSEAQRRKQADIDAADSEADREKMQKRYDAVEWGTDPDLLAEYAAIVLHHDLERRKLSREYQGRGLSSGTRGEIDAATKPKLSKSGPGTRYAYHAGRRDLPKPWRKLVLQFAGGLNVADALSGRSKQLRMRPHPRKNSYRVTQQLGTKDDPCEVEYVLRAHRPLLPGDVIQRWSLVIEQRADDTDDGRWRREAHVTLQRDLPPKSKGTAILNCRLRWTRRSAGIEVAEFTSPQVNESLVIPNWLLDRRLIASQTQAVLDGRANQLLTDRGVDGRGLESLNDWIRKTDGDDETLRFARKARRRMRRARNIERWSIRTIESIYRTVVYRLAARHGTLQLAELDLAESARYDTRDLLKEDKLPKASRTLRQAVAPGKLKAWLQSALPASGEVSGELPGVARNSDVFTSYVASLGPKGGCWSRCGSDRSRDGAEVLGMTGD